jgi:DNA-binding transcriptional MerR regulator
LEPAKRSAHRSLATGAETEAVLYQIGKFAQVSGITVKTLRFYDEVGVLLPASVNPLTGYRYYQPEQLEELASIMALRDMGVPLRDIREMKSKAGTTIGKRELLEGLHRRLKKSIQTAALSLKCIDAELDQIDRGVRSVPVLVKRKAALAIASVRSKVSSYEDIDRFEEMLLNSLPQEAIAEMRGVLWHRCADSGSLEGEPFVALKRRISSRSSCNMKQLPPATLACAYSRTDNDSAELAYDAIRRWIGSRGYKVIGPKREVYLDRALEIQFPINAA